VTVTNGVPFDEYAAIDAVNWSTLREMEKSGAHYRHRLTTPRNDTPAMRFGRAVHTAVLEPDRFPLECVVWDGGDRRGNAWKEFAAFHCDSTILKEDEYATCLAVRDAVRSHPAAAPLLVGDSEIVLEWTDPDTGLACKARLDKAHDGCAVDLKTTTTTDPGEFGRTSGRLLYHCQLAFYQRGLRECGMAGAESVPRVIAVEVAPPYDVVVFALAADAFMTGEMLVGDLLHHVASCRERNEWPGRFANEQELYLPPWMVAEPDGGLGLGITIGGESA
jgi:hypothetical protein